MVGEMSDYAHEKIAISDMDWEQDEGKIMKMWQKKTGRLGMFMLRLGTRMKRPI